MANNLHFMTVNKFSCQNVIRHSSLSFRVHAWKCHRFGFMLQREGASKLVMSAQMEKATGRNICIKFTLRRVDKKAENHLRCVKCGKFSISNFWCFHMCRRWSELEISIFNDSEGPLWLFLDEKRRIDRSVHFYADSGSFMSGFLPFQSVVFAFFSSTARIFLVKQAKGKSNPELLDRRPDWCRNDHWFDWWLLTIL